MIHKRLTLYVMLFMTTLLSLTSASVYRNSKFRKTDNIFDTLTQDIRFTHFVQNIEYANAVSEFKSISKGTVFAPVNEAFELQRSMIPQRQNFSKQELLYHIIPVSHKSGDLHDGDLLDTEARLHNIIQKVKVLKSLTGSIDIGTDSGQDLSHVIEELDATNGMIQVIDKVLPLPLYLDETLSINDDTSNFFDLSKKSRINGDLKNAKGNTIFVAKGDFFGDGFDPIQKKYLLEHHGGRKDLARYLNHQIATKVFYAEDFEEGKSKITTVEGSEDLEIVVEHNKIFPSKITVNGVKVIHSDILSANGVIHVLEGPILPKNKDFVKLSARMVLASMNASRFIDLFDKNGLGSYLDDDQSDVITILAPSDEALDVPKLMSKNDTVSWLKYHIVHGFYNPSDLKDGQLLETESHSNLGKAFQRIDVHITTQDQNNDNEKTFKNTVSFGKAGVLADPVKVNDNLIIYPLARSLVLPRDPLSRLPVNLELSTFVAGLYASGADELIKDTQGITLLAPTNEAFSRLGLLAKFLLQPESQKKLEQVISYHAVRGVFYENSTSLGEHRETTLASNAEILLNKTSEGIYIRGSGAADGNDRNNIAKVIDTDILTSNGVIHTIDRVQLPVSLQITNRDLLSAEGTNSLLSLLDRTNLTKKILDGLDKDTPYTILAPTDKAFGRLNLTHLLENPEKLLKVARLHILPIALPRIDIGETGENSYHYNIYGRKKDDERNHDPSEHKEIPITGVDIPTLHDGAYVVISKGLTGGYTIKVKGTSQEGADVITLGRSSSGGGVIEIDRVLLPKEEYHRNGLPWWAVALIVIGSLAGAAVLAAAAYIGWRYYQSRNHGDIRLDASN